MAYGPSNIIDQTCVEVDSQNTRLLSNLEVFDFLKCRLESKNKVRAQQTLLYTGMKFFQEKSPCTAQTSQQITQFLAAIKKYKLSKEEMLALINACPATQVELSVIIQDLDSRFSVSEIEEVLGVIISSFPDAVAKSASINSSGVADEPVE